MSRFPRMYYAFANEGNVHKIYLYDDITEKGDFNWETWSYNESETSAKHFQELLDQIPEGDIIELYINSAGGSVKEGTAIYNKLKRHKAKKTGYVDGITHSIAFTILQACDVRVMGEGTSVLVHEMWTYAVGNADELRSEADKMDAWMKASRQLILQRTDKITEEELKALMKKETMLGPDEALAYGFIDEIEGREEPVQTEVVMQAAKDLTKLRENMQNKVFDEELKEFEEIAEETKKTEPEQHEVSMMDTFFDMFF